MERQQDISKRNSGKFVNVSFQTAINDQNGEKMVRVKARVHYKEKGQGPVLLLLHDVAQTNDIFKYIMPKLGQDFRVIAPDLLGHGLSDCPDIDYLVEDYSLYLEAFIKALGLENINILACGQSCAYAVDYCWYNQQNIEKMIFINPGSFSDLKLGMATKINSFYGGMVMKLFRNENFVRKMFEKAFFDKTALRDSYIKAFCHPYENPDVQYSVRAAIANFDDSNAIRLLDNIYKPILYLSGNEDLISNRHTSNLYLNSSAVPYDMVIRNCGALPHLEKIENSAMGILRFLSE